MKITKKIVLPFIFILFAGFLAGCASTGNGENQDEINQIETDQIETDKEQVLETVEPVQETAVISEQENLFETEEAEPVEETKKVKKRKFFFKKKSQPEPEYIAIEDLPEPVYDAYSVPEKKWKRRGQLTVKKLTGCLGIIAKGTLGSFNFNIIDRDGNSMAVFSNSEECTGTSFFLKAGKKIYKLSGGSGIKTAARELDNGVQISYIIPKVAHVMVEYTVFSSLPTKDGDIIKMTAYVKSLKSRREDFSLKLVMDTEIGERNKYHFYGSDNNPITTETIFRSSSENRWIMTGNELSGFQILLDGADITVPEFVAVANFENLDNFSWEPGVLSSRSFDTVSSYNNSACCISWKKNSLEKDQQSSQTVYFAVASFPDMVTGENYINTLKSDKVEVQEEKKDTVKIITETPDVSETVVPVLKAEEESKAQPAISVTEIEVTPEPAYSEEYINRLLNRISELEAGGKGINQEELLLLNEELDHILQQLRKK